MKKLTEKQLFKQKNIYLKGRFEVVSPLEFYRDLFPEGSLEAPGSDSDRKPNMIVASCYRKTDEEIAAIDARESLEKQLYEEARERGEDVKKPKRYRRRVVENRLVFDDFAELEELITKTHERLEFVIIPPVAFSGKNRTKENAYHMWAIAIDLDGVEMDQLDDLVYQIETEAIPVPTYLVNSGHGMHLYYCFEDPVPMYPYLQEQLQALKRALTDCVWNAYTSTISTEKRQYQSIVQGYRAVGSVTKLGKNYRVTAYRVGPKRTLQYLKDWAEDNQRLDFDEFNHTTLDEAREKWPEWYEQRIVKGLSRKPFKFKHRGVYEAWLRRMAEGAFDGNRYKCIAVLFSVAYKTEGISFEEVLDDAMELIPRLNRLTRKEKNQFTVDDVLDASSFYDEQFQTLSLKGVYHMTKIYIKPTNRNHRPQEVHLKRIRALQDLDDPGRSWRNNDGRPKGSKDKEQRSRIKDSKQIVVEEYMSAHPEASVTEIARALGISRPTVYKWMNEKRD